MSICCPGSLPHLIVSLCTDTLSKLHLVLLFLQAPISDHIRPIALSAITRFVEWVEFNVLLMQECKLLLLLYTFISLEELKTASCECLLVILARKAGPRGTQTEPTEKHCHNDVMQQPFIALVPFPGFSPVLGCCTLRNQKVGVGAQ